VLWPLLWTFHLLLHNRLPSVFAFFPLAEGDCSNVEGLEVRQALTQDGAGEVRNLRVDACEDGEADEFMQNRSYRRSDVLEIRRQDIKKHEHEPITHPEIKVKPRVFRSKTKFMYSSE
jgi:hypothetical protein